MTAVSDQELSLLSITESQVAFNADQKKAIVDVLRVKHASDADMAVFFHMARKTGLDPFRRQLYMLARQEYDSESRGKVWRQTFQTGIDGYRVIAERYAAARRTTLKKATFRYWDNQGQEFDAWWKDEPPAMIRATVQVGDENPVSWDARFTEYVPLKDEYVDVLDEKGKPKRGADGKTITEKSGKKVPQGMWASRPTAQLEKCAEAGALRRACPEDLSGLYVDAEMSRDLQTVEVIEEHTVQTASNRNWLNEISEATEADQLREIFRESGRAGERSSAIAEAISTRVAELQSATKEETETPEESATIVDQNLKAAGSEGLDAEGLPLPPADWQSGE